MRFGAVRTAIHATAVIAGLCGGVTICAASEPPVCFPERTVMWAAYLLDEDGNDFGIIRAGHTVRVLETGVGKDGALSKVEIDKPSEFTALVESRQLLAFTATEIDIEPGFSSVVKGLSVRIEGQGKQRASISPADPHREHKPEWTLSAKCGDLRGTPPGEVSRSWCQGGHVRRSTVWVRDTRAFWERDVEMVCPDGKHRTRLPSKEWAYLIADGKDQIQAAYWDDKTNVVYRGMINRAGVQFVPERAGYADHLCCEGALPPRVEPFFAPDERGTSRQFLGFSLAKLVKPARLRPRPGSKTVLHLPPNEPVAAAADKNGFNAIKWPSRIETSGDFDTIILYGFVEPANVEFAVPRLRDSPKPASRE
ncbi:MAG: hypothetical protein HY897_14765 [Deltaproteobacteria bacterium]|nr:hypothetical protein [Deltaproteobacteria bacterium]